MEGQTRDLVNSTALIRSTSMHQSLSLHRYGYYSQSWQCPGWKFIRWTLEFMAEELEEEICLEQPEGFKVGTEKKDSVGRLRKSIYGLKQAPRVWDHKNLTFLKSIGFEQTYE